MRSNLSLSLVDTRTSITLCARVTYGTSENTWSSIAAGYISIPEGEGQFVPVIWRVHGDSLTVIQSLATLFLFPILPFSHDLSLFPSAPSPSILVTTLLLQQLPYSVVIESPAILTEWRLLRTVQGFYYCKCNRKPHRLYTYIWLYYGHGN